MSNDLIIGSTNFEGGVKRNKTMKLEKGDNFFRILPPMYSLVQSGRYAQFHAVHWMQKSPNSAGKAQWVSFKNIEQRKYEGNKFTITKQDPIEVKYQELYGIYENAKEALKNGTAQFKQDDLKAFFELNVNPLKTSKRYYLNGIKLDNTVQVIELPITAFKAVDELIRRLKSSKQIDATDLNKGVFINVIRSGEGRETKYTAEIMREAIADGAGGFVEKFKMHTVTPEIMEQMKVQCRDLTTLFKEISEDDMKAIANADPANRTALLDRIFAKAEPSQVQPDVEDSGIVNTAPNVDGVKGFTQVAVGASGVTLNSPNFQSLNTNKQGVSLPGVPITPPVGTPIGNLVNQQPTVQVQTPPVNTPPSGNLSDDQFKAMFMNKAR